MNGWHENPDDWHGPVDRTERASVWDARTQGVVEKIVEYRRCGCTIWRPAETTPIHEKKVLGI